MRVDSKGTIWRTGYFHQVTVGETFHCNGNVWRKRSSRTAVMVRPVEYAGKWFYFRQNELLEREYTQA